MFSSILCVPTISISATTDLLWLCDFAFVLLNNVCTFIEHYLHIMVSTWLNMFYWTASEHHGIYLVQQVGFRAQQRIVRVLRAMCSITQVISFSSKRQRYYRRFKGFKHQQHPLFKVYSFLQCYDSFCSDSSLFVQKSIQIYHVNVAVKLSFFPPLPQTVYLQPRKIIPFKLPFHKSNISCAKWEYYTTTIVKLQPFHSSQ